MKTYISGKITGLPMQQVRNNFKEAEDLILNLGLEALNPLNNGLKPSDSWENHMIRDIEMLMGCDAILMLDNWMDSKGARIEKYIAEERGMMVLFCSKVVKRKKIEDAIDSVIGLKFKDYTAKTRKRKNYFARLIFVHYCSLYEGLSTEKIAVIVNRSFITIRPYLTYYEKELKYNPEFRKIVESINYIL